jgi:hypothetical protein
LGYTGSVPGVHTRLAEKLPLTIFLLGTICRMDLTRLRFIPLTLFFGVLSASSLPGSILVGTALPTAGEHVSLACEAICDTAVYWGATGFTIDDRQRLAQEFSFIEPVQVDSISVGISTSYLSSTDILVFLTDGLETPGNGQGAHILYEGELPLSPSLTAQTYKVTTDLQLNAATRYYLVLVEENGANAETNGRTSELVENSGYLGQSYFANAGLAIDPLKGNWTSLGSPTIAFELDGAHVPEPSHLALSIFGILIAIVGRGLNAGSGLSQWRSRHARS